MALPGTFCFFNFCSSYFISTLEPSLPTLGLLPTYCWESLCTSEGATWPYRSDPCSEQLWTRAMRKCEVFWKNSISLLAMAGGEVWAQNLTVHHLEVHHQPKQKREPNSWSINAPSSNTFASLHRLLRPPLSLRKVLHINPCSCSRNISPRVCWQFL